jgi:tRNA-2-methylthio-N6-dimethylallyladenosine synthase
MAYGRANPVWPEGRRSLRGWTEPLPRLLEALQEIPGLARLRFTSGHPSGCTPELIRALAELPVLCGHLHLPLQSGSDRILRRMNRGYTAAEYLAAVRRLRSAVPGMALTTDIIVGFPSETLADFDLTRGLLAEIGFDNAFIFQYNARPQTPAARWPDDVPAEEKRRRNHQLLAEQNRQCLAINQALVGRELEVLVEGPSPRNAARWTGRTRTNKIVLFAAAPALRRGDLLKVRIERAKIQTLDGTVNSQNANG